MVFSEDGLVGIKRVTIKAENGNQLKKMLKKPFIERDVLVL
jgi:hypothetical protein